MRKTSEGAGIVNCSSTRGIRSAWARCVIQMAMDEQRSGWRETMQEGALGVFLWDGGRPQTIPQTSCVNAGVLAFF